MRQALYRATLNSKAPALSQALSGWIDAAQIQADTADDLFRRGGTPSGMSNVPRERMQQALESAADKCRRNCWSSFRDNRPSGSWRIGKTFSLLKIKRRRPAPPRRAISQTLQRAKEDVAAGARDLAIDPSAGDLENRLKIKVDASTALLRSTNPVDYATAAHDWSEEIQKSAPAATIP